MVYDNAHSLSYTILLKNQSANLIFFAYVPVRQNLSRQTRCLPRSCIHASCLPWAVTPIRDSYKCKIPLRVQRTSAHECVRATECLRHAAAEASVRYRYVQVWPRLPSPLPQSHGNPLTQGIPTPSGPPQYHNCPGRNRCHFYGHSKVQ